MSAGSSLIRSVRWPAVVIAVALVLSFGGGAVAKATYDAKNAHKVDGKHAVGAHATIENRKGKLVATDTKTGRLPSDIVTNVGNSAHLGGYTHQQMSTMSVSPQGVFVSGTAAQSYSGPNLTPTGIGEFRFSFVVPPDHNPAGTLWVDVVYREDSPGACTWVVETSGLEGPDSPTGSDIHNGGWKVPGTTGYSGPIAVPAGEGSVHTARFSWPFDDKPGMFIQFAVDRLGDDPADNCGFVGIYGLQVRY